MENELTVLEAQLDRGAVLQTDLFRKGLRYADRETVSLPLHNGFPVSFQDEALLDTSRYGPPIERPSDPAPAMIYVPNRCTLPSRPEIEPLCRHCPRRGSSETPRNVLIIGPTGVDKTFVAYTLGNAAWRQGFRARYHRVPRLLGDLEPAKADGSYPDFIGRRKPNGPGWTHPPGLEAGSDRP